MASIMLKICHRKFQNQKILQKTTLAFGLLFLKKYIKYARVLMYDVGVSSFSLIGKESSQD